MKQKYNSFAKVAEEAVEAAEVKKPGFMDNPLLVPNEEGTGHLRPSVKAVGWWLEHPDAHLSAVRYNRLEGRIDATSVPWNAEAHGWDDSDQSHLYAMLQEKTGGLLNSRKDLEDALVIFAQAHSYDPLVEMLDGLPEWDGVERADTLLSDFLGAEDSPYTRAAGRLMLNGAVMRAYHPGAKFDIVVVIVGDQGIQKSAFCRALALEDRFFTDSLTTFNGKDALDLIQGIWIVELGELAAFGKTTQAHIKQFVSAQSDDFRHAYGKYTKRHERRCIFVATTNERDFLRDPTGSRRFLPVICHAGRRRFGVIDNEPEGGVNAYMQQVWAEVLAEYRAGGTLPLTMPPELAEATARAREGVEADDPNRGLVAEWLARNCVEGDRVCLFQIMTQVYSISRDRLNDSSGKRMQNSLRILFDNQLNDRLVRVGRVKHSAEYGQQTCWEYRPVG